MGVLTQKETAGLLCRDTGADGMFVSGQGGVQAIYATGDRKTDFIEYRQSCLGYVHSAMGYPALYPVRPVEYAGRAKTVLMDLDGTSVHSEEFWMYIIERTMAGLLGNPRFQLEACDVPFVSGHSVSEHLLYCIGKYAPDKTVEQARQIYLNTTEYEMNEILQGRGKAGAFTPAPFLKEFLTELKGRGVKIGLVTSGLYNKAMPEIISAFRTLGMGDPVEFYDAIITAGTALIKGQTGTIGELAPKPHPWLYAETARVGLGLEESDRPYVLGLEDSGAGIVSLRLCNFASVGVAGGNIEKSGTKSLCTHFVQGLQDVLELC